MAASDHLRKLVAQNQSEDNAVSWQAARVLGLLTEKHFLAVIEALERHGECEELLAFRETLGTLLSEAGSE